MTEKVSDGFAAFLRREIYCTATGCNWQWEEDENKRRFVACQACGSQYPPTITYLLGRVYKAEEKQNG